MLYVLFLDLISRSEDIGRKGRLATHNYRFLILKLNITGLLYSGLSGEHPPNKHPDSFGMVKGSETREDENLFRLHEDVERGPRYSSVENFHNLKSPSRYYMPSSLLQEFRDRYSLK